MKIYFTRGMHIEESVLTRLIEENKNRPIREIVEIIRTAIAVRQAA